MDGVFKVINDFTSITVEFNREQNLQGVIDNNEELSEELKTQLIQLNYLTYRLSNETDPCPGDNKIINLADDDQTAYSILSDFKGLNDQEFSTVSPKQIFLGLDEEKFKKDVSKYKLSFSENKDVYLFKHTLPGTQNEVWVMAEVDKTNKWRVGGNVRVHNLLVGVSSNLDDEINMSAGLYRGRSFIIYETNFNDVRKLKAGTAFRNKSGGVYADTDFKKFHNVTLFINLN